MTSGRRAGLWSHLLLAALAYVPLLRTAPGRVAADTKTYLYLDPGRLLERAPSMWDPNIGLGTVTHQNIGYLFPMGPWFWALDTIGLPDWVAQRLWVATIMFAAGAGVLYLFRTLGGSTVRFPRGAALAAACLYMLSPYVLHYAARISVLLLPWAALPWMIGLVQRALRTGSWRHPAMFAIVVTLVGGVNATALVLAGLGPVLWLPFAVWAHREVTLRRAVVTTARTGGLTLACSLWWLSGLAVQGGYGIDILRYTETVETVARTSLSIEVLRGLGYWFFYGGDKLGPWIEPGRSYTQQLWLVAVGFAVPLLAFVSAAVLRWRYRAYFVGLVLVGTAVAVGAHPYAGPSPAGAAFKAFATSSTAGLALRSTPRAVPLVVLGLAVLVGAGLASLAARARRPATIASALAVVLAAAGLPPLWNGDFIGENLQRPEDVPDYWEEAAAYLDSRDDGTRVLELPGIDFASYRWGNTVDPITPGIIDRPYVARELIPYGSEASADLLIALDRRIQEGVLEPDAVMPVARLLGVGDIVLRNDLQYERYRTARPRALWELFAGFGRPKTFGDDVVNRAPEPLPLVDEVELSTPDAVGDPPAVAVFEVDDPLPIVRARPSARPILLAGDGEGVVDAAAAGLLDGESVLLTSAALAGEPEVRQRALDDGAALVLTDTNRRRGRRWSTVRENSGATERAGEEPLVDDPTDNRLPLFPDAGDDAATVVEQRGGATVSATAYGNPVSYTPEDRAVQALDGDVSTAWRVGAFSDVRGERLRIDLDEPVEVGSLDVVQPLNGPRNRFITRVEVYLDGESAGVFDLDGSSRTEKGQRLDLRGNRSFSRLELEVVADNTGVRARYDGLSGVGLAEVRVGDVRVEEVVRLPRDLLAGTSGDRDLAVVLTRLRSNPAEVVRQDEERSLVRSFELPTRRSFAVTGEARVAAGVDEAALDALLGTTGAVARSSGRLAGGVDVRASQALDGDPTTAWSYGFGEQTGAWVEVSTGAPLTIDRLDLQLVTDGRHSVPTRLRLEADGRPAATVDVPATTDLDERGATTPVTVTFPAVTATTLRVVVDAVRPVTNTDWFSEEPIAAPVAIAELGVPGVSVTTPSDRFDSGCRTDLLEIDGEAVGLRIKGRRGSVLDVATCDGAAVDLGPGDHLVRAARGRDTALDLDRLVLRADGGSPAPAARAPELVVEEQGRTSLDLSVEDAREPFWLVLGQSRNAGWQASVDGGTVGDPVLADGFGNGWYVTPDGGPLEISLTWAPQRRVNVALGLSALAFLGCVAIVLGARRRRPTVPVSAGRGPVSPTLRTPGGPAGRRPGRRETAVVAVACGVVAGVLVHPLAGLLALAACAVALRTERGVRLPAAAAVVTLAVGAAYVVVKQARNDYPPDFGWPTFFEAAHWLGWVAVVLLAVDAVVEVVRDRSRPISGE